MAEIESQEQKEYRKRKAKKYFRNFLFLLGFCCLLLGIRTFVFQAYFIQGNSMSPTLKHGTIALAWKAGFPIPFPFFSSDWVYSSPEIRKMDIVLFSNQKGEILVKRVIGLPGEFYSIEAGRVLIDSQKLEEKYLPVGTKTTMSSSSVFFDFNDSPFLPMDRQGRIPPFYYLLLGDNRDFSSDSRALGLVPFEKIRGRVIYFF